MSRTFASGTFDYATMMLKQARDTTYQRIVAQRLVDGVLMPLRAESVEPAGVVKNCGSSGSSQEAYVSERSRTKRGLAAAQPPLSATPQVPSPVASQQYSPVPPARTPAVPQQQPIMPQSQIGQPMQGAAPPVNGHGKPAMAGQIGTPGTGLDAPQDTRAAAMPGTPGHAATNAIDMHGGLDPRGMTIEVNDLGYPVYSGSYLPRMQMRFMLAASVKDLKVNRNHSPKI